MPPSSSAPDSFDDDLWNPGRFARRILDSAGEGIVIYDRELRYRVWNRFMEERTGLGANELYGRVCYELFPHLVHEGAIDYLYRALAGESVTTPDLRYWLPYNDRTGWFRARYEPYRDDHGAIVGVIGHLHDITARRDSEDRLRQSETRLRAIIDGASDVVSIIDRNGVTTYVSPSVETVLGITIADFVDRNPLERIHPEDHERVLETFRSVVATPGVSQRVQYRIRHGSGSWRVLLSVSKNLLDEPLVNGIVVNSRDVTEWQELQERLHQSQKIEAVGRLAGGVAHDFNNLLTVISGNAQLLLGDGAFPSGAREELEEIAQAADRAATLTRQLLAFSRQQVLQPRVLDLGTVVTGMWKLLARLVGEAARLHWEPGESLGAVTADPVQIEQVLINLVLNARDAMPDGGDITIRTANATADAAFAATHAPMPPGEYVLLEVRDSGVGMDATTLARAFEPFFTTKRQGQGIGMGLSTVYGVVKQSGGYIWGASAPGHGASFSIYLPRTPRADGRTLTPPMQRAATSRRSETILVVEDEDLVRALTRRTLEREGYQVLDAANGRDALQLARELGASLDLLLTDMVMPVMGGRELAAELHLERPSLQVLFMSGYTHEREAHFDRGGGVSHFLHKPFTLEELRLRVRLLLDQAAASPA